MPSLLTNQKVEEWHMADLHVHLSIANGFVSSKIYDKRDDFDFDIVNFPIFGW